MARRLAAAGAQVVIADIDTAAGEAVAAGIGGLFVRADVGQLADTQAAVAAAKHAVVGLVRSLAPSLVTDHITINALCPTFVDTPILGGDATS